MWFLVHFGTRLSNKDHALYNNPSESSKLYSPFIGPWSHLLTQLIYSINWSELKRKIEQQSAQTGWDIFGSARPPELELSSLASLHICVTVVSAASFSQQFDGPLHSDRREAIKRARRRKEREKGLSKHDVNLSVVHWKKTQPWSPNDLPLSVNKWLKYEGPRTYCKKGESNWNPKVMILPAFNDNSFDYLRV